MSADKRGAAIMKILIAKRQVTICEIAQELCVSDRTISSDIATLTAIFPIETARGNGGGVRLSDSYKVNRNGFTPEDIVTISEIVPLVKNKEQERVLRKIIELLM